MFRVWFWALFLLTSSFLCSLTRRCNQETTLYGIDFKPGMCIEIPLTGVHYNPEFYPDPYTFKPERSVLHFSLLLLAPFVEHAGVTRATHIVFSLFALPFFLLVLFLFFRLPPVFEDKENNINNKEETRPPHAGTTIKSSEKSQCLPFEFGRSFYLVFLYW